MANNDKEKVTGAEVTTKAVKKVKNQKLGFFKRIAKWWREMKSELKKVIWPGPKQVFKNTVVSLVVMLVFAVVLWGFDSLASAIVQFLISIFG